MKLRIEFFVNPNIALLERDRRSFNQILVEDYFIPFGVVHSYNKFSDTFIVYHQLWGKFPYDPKTGTYRYAFYD